MDKVAFDGVKKFIRKLARGWGQLDKAFHLLKEVKDFSVLNGLSREQKVQIYLAFSRAFYIISRILVKLSEAGWKPTDAEREKFKSQTGSFPIIAKISN